jgi:hypothetical protein
VEQVEGAYASALAKATGPNQRRVAADLRDRRLAAILDQSYEALLAWLIDNPPQMKQLEREYVDYQAERERLLAAGSGNSPEATGHQVDLASKLILERLREFQGVVDLSPSQ